MTFSNHNRRDIAASDQVVDESEKLMHRVFSRLGIAAALLQLVENKAIVFSP